MPCFRFWIIFSQCWKSVENLVFVLFWLNILFHVYLLLLPCSHCILILFFNTKTYIFFQHEMDCRFILKWLFIHLSFLLRRRFQGYCCELLINAFKVTVSVISSVPTIHKWQWPVYNGNLKIFIWSSKN